MATASHWQRSAMAILLLPWFSGAVLSGAPAPRPDSARANAPEVQIAKLGAFKFESGETIDDLRVSYVTHGKLNADRSNAILALHHFWGDHQDLDFLIGPGKALDTDRYFIVAADILANSKQRRDVTTGPTNSGLKMQFPQVTARDWVNGYHKLAKEHLGIDRVVAVTGASIGGINSYQFAVSHPDYVAAIIPIAGTPRTNPQTRLMLQNMMQTIALDPAWLGGMYESNPALGVELALMNATSWLYAPGWYPETLTSAEKVRDFSKRWRYLWNASGTDARDLYYQLQGWAEFNLGDTRGFNGDTKAALASIKAKALIIGAKDDMLFKPDESQLARAAIPGAIYLEIPTSYGHLICCGGDKQSNEIMHREIGKFLASVK